jgi:putative copper resistance protein D
VYLATDAVVLGLRGLGFVAVFHAMGTALFLWLFGRDLDAALGAIRTLAKASALVAVALTVLYHVLVPARMAGSFAATFDPSLGELVLQSNIGPAHAVRVAGLAVLAVSVDEQNRFNLVASAVGVTLTLLSFALMGHTTIHGLRLMLAPLLLVHVGVAAFWFGSLWPLHLVATRESIETSGRVVTRFSALAVRCVPLILICGTAMTLVFVRSFGELVTGYGAMIVLKTLAYAALLGLAALNRQRFVPAIAAARSSALVSFKQVLRTEWWLIAAVIMATALMTELFSPENLHASFSSEHDEAD